MSARKPVINDAILDQWSVELKASRRGKRTRSARRRVAHLYNRYCRAVACCRPPKHVERAAELHEKRLRRGSRIRRRMLHLAAGLE